MLKKLTMFSSLLHYSSCKKKLKNIHGVKKIEKKIKSHKMKDEKYNAKYMN